MYMKVEQLLTELNRNTIELSKKIDLLAEVVNKYAQELEKTRDSFDSFSRFLKRQVETLQSFIIQQYEKGRETEEKTTSKMYNFIGRFIDTFTKIVVACIVGYFGLKAMGLIS